MTTDEQGYNGWKNYETWAVGLWLGNDEGSYNLTREMAVEVAEDSSILPNVASGIWSIEEAERFVLADRLKDLVIEEMLPNLEASLAADLLNAAVSEVEWSELAENMLSGRAS